VNVSLSDRDLTAMLDIAHTSVEDLPPDGLPLPLLESLIDLVECDGLSVFDCNCDNPAEGWMQEAPSTGVEVDEQLFWQHYWDTPHCSYPDRTGDTTSVTMTSDFATELEHHASGMYVDYTQHFGVEHELMVVLPLGHHHAVRLLFARGKGTDFTERDRAVLQLLRPHLNEILHRADAARRQVPELTPRQWELMRLVAGGYTNAQIARRLVLSEATVRKHLENIFHRLDVNNRTAAIVLAFPERVGA